MITGSLQRRRTCPALVLDRIAAAHATKFHIVQQIGPLAFIIRPEENPAEDDASLVSSKDVEAAYRVRLGSRQTCTCSSFRKNDELCVHIVRAFLAFLLPHGESFG